MKEFAKSAIFQPFWGHFHIVKLVRHKCQNQLANSNIKHPKPKYLLFLGVTYIHPCLKQLRYQKKLQVAHSSVHRSHFFCQKIERKDMVNRVSHFWVKMEIQTVSGKYDCLSHPGTINIQVQGVLCYYLPANFDICVVQVLLCENGLKTAEKQHLLQIIS